MGTKALKVTTDGVVEEIAINDYTDIQAVVGGLFDVAGLEGNVFVNDEGLLVGLPYNPVASLYAKQHLVGDAVVTGFADAEGNTTDINDLTMISVKGIALFLGVGSAEV
ncbi:MAG: DUF3846 domain-containing protein [Thiohalomonadaceae bacterium]